MLKRRSYLYHQQNGAYHSAFLISRKQARYNYRVLLRIGQRLELETCAVLLVASICSLGFERRVTIGFGILKQVATDPRNSGDNKACKFLKNQSCSHDGVCERLVTTLITRITLSLTHAQCVSLQIHSSVYRFRRTHFLYGVFPTKSLSELRYDDDHHSPKRIAKANPLALFVHQKYVEALL